jgi:phenylacetate-coenzyme A ligase PaaK-like adenylate-forming protein
MISAQQIFSISSERDFNDAALEVFTYQAKHCSVYRDYVNMLGVHAEEVKSFNEIPFLPVEFFKTHEVLSDEKKPEIIFESSGTTGATVSRHYVADKEIYIQSFTCCFEKFYENISDYCILALLPSYLERKNSSLVFMAQHLIKSSRNPQSGFYLSEFNKLSDALKNLNKARKKNILLGVSYALLDFAEQFPVELPYTIIMETGGMKGRRNEMTREELHSSLGKAFALNAIHSEYGMTELLSQAYSQGNGIFYCPPWMKILLRNPDDPFDVSESRQSGNINIIDLANIYSCSFIATQDVGKISGKGFEVLGRTDNSDLRGCNLLVSEM